MACQSTLQVITDNLSKYITGDLSKSTLQVTCQSTVQVITGNLSKYITGNYR